MHDRAIVVVKAGAEDSSGRGCRKRIMLDEPISLLWQNVRVDKSESPATGVISCYVVSCGKAKIRAGMQECNWDIVEACRLLGFLLKKLTIFGAVINIDELDF